MANEQNLIPVRTENEAREKGRNGGIKSGEARRNRKSFREILNELMAMPLNDADMSELENVVSFMQLQGKNVDVGTAICIKQTQRALKGDSRAYEIIRDTAGEKPKLESGASKASLDKLDEVLAKIGGVTNEL